MASWTFTMLHLLPNIATGWGYVLLFSLIAHNLVSALASNTFLPVLSAGSITVGLNVFKSLKYPVYKLRLNDLLETLFFLNLAILAYGTFYTYRKHKWEPMCAIVQWQWLLSCMFVMIV